MKANKIDKDFLNYLSGEVLDSAIEVHRNLGPELPVFYKGEKLPKTFQIDILVEKAVIIELKSVEFILSIHEAQIISYLKLANLNLGLLINFNAPLLKDGFKRYINNW